MHCWILCSVRIHTLSHVKGVGKVMATFQVAFCDVQYFMLYLMALQSRLPRVSQMSRGRGGEGEGGWATGCPWVIVQRTRRPCAYVRIQLLPTRHSLLAHATGLKQDRRIAWIATRLRHSLLYGAEAVTIWEP